MRRRVQGHDALHLTNFEAFRAKISEIRNSDKIYKLKTIKYIALLRFRDPCSAVSASLDITGKMVLAFLFLAPLGLLYSASRLWPKLIGIVLPPLRGKSPSSETEAHEGPVSFPPEMPVIHHVPDWTRIVLTLQSCLLCLLLGAPLEPDGGEPPGHAEHALELRRRGPPPRQTTAGGRVAVVLGVDPLDVLVVGVVVRVLGAATARRLLGDDHVFVRTLL